MDSLSLESFRTAAAIISSVCAVIAAVVSVAVYRNSRHSDLGKRIADGDKSVRDYAEETLAEFRESLEEVKDAVARVETLQESEAKHMVRHSDLSKIHDKINRVAEDTAAIRAESRTAMQGMREQLRVIQDHIMRTRP